MKPLTILIIRHAEKPDHPEQGPGFSERGDKDKESLIIRGWQRAGTWAALFGTGLGGSDYPIPDRIYAAAPGADGAWDQGPSRRPYETVLPLAARLGKPIDTAYAKEKSAALVTERLLSLEGVVLVSWEHRAIVDTLVPAIPVAHGSPPSDWPGHRFDVVLRFDRPAGATKFAYRPLYPKLLAGDSDLPLDG